MTLIKKTLAAAFLTLATLSAQAAVFDSTSDKAAGTINALSYLDVTHTLNGYSKDQFTLIDATLLVYLRDTTGNETFKVTLGYGGKPQEFIGKDSTDKKLQNIPGGSKAAQFEFYFDPATTLADLQDGVFTFRITSLTGTNFIYDSSSLIAEGEEVLPPSAVPEPMSLGLFAIALLGFGAARRRMK